MISRVPVSLKAVKSDAGRACRFPQINIEIRSISVQSTSRLNLDILRRDIQSEIANALDSGAARFGRVAGGSVSPERQLAREITRSVCERAGDFRQQKGKQPW